MKAIFLIFVDTLASCFSGKDPIKAGPLYLFQEPLIFQLLVDESHEFNNCESSHLCAHCHDFLLLRQLLRGPNTNMLGDGEGEESQKMSMEVY